METDSFIMSTLTDLQEQAPGITMGKYRGMISALPLSGWGFCLVINLNNQKPNYGPKMAVHSQSPCEGTSALVLRQIRELIKTKARHFVGLFVGLLSSWISNLETRRTPHADPSTSLQEQKEGTRSRKGKKQFGMPLASRGRV